MGVGGVEIHLLRQRVCTDVENAGSQQTGWKLQARPEKALLSTVQANASCVPHSNPGLGSPLPLILQLEKLDANEIKFKLNIFFGHCYLAKPNSQPI